MSLPYRARRQPYLACATSTQGCRRKGWGGAVDSCSKSYLGMLREPNHRPKVTFPPFHTAASPCANSGRTASLISSSLVHKGDVASLELSVISITPHC